MQERRTRRLANQVAGSGVELSAKDFNKKQAEAEANAANLLKELALEDNIKADTLKKKTEKKKEALSKANSLPAALEEAPSPASTYSPAGSSSGGVCQGGAAAKAGQGAADGESRQKPGPKASKDKDKKSVKEEGGAKIGHCEPPLAQSRHPPGSKAAKEEELRTEWNELLEQGSKCLDPSKQIMLLAAIQDMLPRVQETGISAKYGRKVMQRLEAVTPARQALLEALSSDPPSRQALDAALKLAKPVQSLLVGDMYSQAELLYITLTKEAEQKHWDSLAKSLSWAPTPTPQPPCMECADDVQANQGVCPVCMAQLELCIEILS
eukprot:gene32123-16642_t